ncbi:Hint domain-containing protein [Algirhabdus cladophorae]|uniref:Hint domain-containing protein n=1 Tax=Algirhabdus cladophorae TaxID=3377108 RepID=UPI003B84667F
MVAASELPIDTGASALEMAQEIFGSGVTIVTAAGSAPSYNGDSRSSGIYTDGDATSPGVTPGDTGVILSTGRAQDFTNTTGQSNQNTNTSTNTFGQTNNADFNAAVGTNTYDAAFLEVDFIPTGDFMTMQFVFASDEYPEYSNSIYNDAVGVWVNGALVPLSVGDGSTSVGNVNNVDNINLYNDNTQDQFNTEMDGFTVTMSLTIPVNSGAVNSIKIGIADVGDSSYDSSLLIAGNSVQTSLIADDDSTTVLINGTNTVDVLGNDIGSGTLTVTHINGQAVVAGSTVTLASGDSITLNADGTFEVEADSDADTFNFTYQVADTNGNTDTGIVTVDTIPCFVAGTLIATPDGQTPVEDLAEGDLVMTKDEGPQPLRWIGQRTVPAVGDYAPIQIAANTFGRHETLMVSPLHRVLIRDALAELLFGEAEVLVAAKDLINDHSVQRIDGGDVRYVHLLFDKHQVVFSGGLTTESFLPGPQTTNCFEVEVVREICKIFPELDPETGKGYSPAARRTLRHFEARLLASKAA